MLCASQLALCCIPPHYVACHALVDTWSLSSKVDGAGTAGRGIMSPLPFCALTDVRAAWQATRQVGGSGDSAQCTAHYTATERFKAP